jgi:hypothetical protein
MRKRHAARPVLECVEDRLVLSASASLSHAHAAVAGLAAQHSRATPAVAPHHAANHAAKSEATTPRHHAAKAAHPHHHSSSSSSSSLTSSFNNFLKSIGL